MRLHYIQMQLVSSSSSRHVLTWERARRARPQCATLRPAAAAWDRRQNEWVNSSISDFDVWILRNAWHELDKATNLVVVETGVNNTAALDMTIEEWQRRRIFCWRWFVGQSLVMA
jgi:hypothetical protein